MRAEINQTALELVRGDITQQDVEAIVNAANTSLLGGGGVDGAIHRAAGPQLLAETRTLNGCKTGDAKISGGYNLKARHVIHTVGPVYRANDSGVARLLASAYRRSLEVAAEHDLKSIAFPAISTGVYGYPLETATRIALETVCAFAGNSRPTLVRFVAFDANTQRIYEQTLVTLSQARTDLHLSGEA
ncbi:MAG: O-acetyl-ADP-ribose deacetylase [Chloroflexi bacterium]|nr:O-acetyl-ADP-ribose deacetylase [Chloroflexota bacterium]